jgi:hypothetical protein
MPADGIPVAGTNAPVWLLRSVSGRVEEIELGHPACELDWIADLLDTKTPELGIERVTKKRVAWRGTQAFLRDVAELRERVIDRHDALIARLVAARLVTREEADKLRCKVEVAVRDDRKDKREPLPQLEPTPPRTR